MHGRYRCDRGFFGAQSDFRKRYRDDSAVAAGVDPRGQRRFLDDLFQSRQGDVPRHHERVGENNPGFFLLYAEELPVQRERRGPKPVSGVLPGDRSQGQQQRSPFPAGDHSAPAADLLRDYTLSDFSTSNDLLLAIEKERRVELAFENHRWFDLVRTGRAKDVMTAEQKFDGYSDFTWSDDALAYPIPMTVMQSNPGKIIQNKGYTQL